MSNFNGVKRGERGIMGKRSPWRHDPLSKKFSHDIFFGTLNPIHLPPTLGRTLRPIENQKNTLRCTGYGCAVNGGYMRGMRFHPDWQAAKIGQLQGESVDVNGGDPNMAMRSERDCGFLPSTLDSIHSLASNTIENTGIASFDTALDIPALENRVAGFVSVDGSQDIFDNIRSALYLAYDVRTGLGATVQAFGRWYGAWTNPPGGIIPSVVSGTSFGYHHYLFVDFKDIGGVSHLVIHNSGGEAMGDHGLQYMPREVVNREFGVWGTSLKICKPLTDAQIALAKDESVAGKIQRLILQVWYAISEAYLNRRS